MESQEHFDTRRRDGRSPITVLNDPQNPAPEPDVWLTGKEAAIRFRISEKTLANWRSSGTGPAYHRAGRILYRAADIEQWLEGRRHEPRR